MRKFSSIFRCLFTSQKTCHCYAPLLANFKTSSKQVCNICQDMRWLSYFWSCLPSNELGFSFSSTVIMAGASHHSLLSQIVPSFKHKTHRVLDERGWKPSTFRATRVVFLFFTLSFYFHLLGDSEIVSLPL